MKMRKKCTLSIEFPPRANLASESIREIAWGEISIFR
jgi:hypothetical protein